MKLPFVSRERYDELAARYDAVLKDRLEQFADTVGVVPRERSKLTQAIRDQARGPDGSIDRRLLSYFRGRASELLNKGKSVDDTIEQISQWQTTEDAGLGLTIERMMETADGDI